MVHMKLKTDNAIADHVRGSFGEDRISVWEGDGYTVVSASVPFAGYDAEECGLGEFDITTDPTEAPADALLEAAGYYVEPGDRVVVGADFPFTVVGHYKKVSGIMHCEELRSLWCGGWDQYSWDVKPDLATSVLCLPSIPPDAWRDIESAWNEAKRKKAPCTQCNGSGRVDGFLGVGIQIPCGECGGEGSR